MKRILLLFVLVTLLLPVEAQQLKTRNVVVVTLDGFRWRELFNGANPRFLEHYSEGDTSILNQYGGVSSGERREKLMPFFWNVIAREGQIYGNRRFGNKMDITNPNFYSYSGYSEMFVGFVDSSIRDNTPRDNPNESIFHRVNQHPEYKGDVAVFSTWNVMANILRENHSTIHMNTGAEKAAGRRISEREHILNFLSDSIDNPLGERFDKFTFQYAFEYMKREKPRVVYISLDETDERAHAGQYIPYLNSANRADRMISELWSWLQSQPEYRDQTTLIVGTDHGRGRSMRGWKHHRLLFRGSAQVWLAVLGPDTPPTGEMKQRMQLKQNQVAKTIGAFLNMTYSNVRPVGEVITPAFSQDVLMPVERAEVKAIEDENQGG